MNSLCFDLRQDYKNAENGFKPREFSGSNLLTCESCYAVVWDEAA